MILTRIYLNARRQGARKLLGSPQAMHAAILSGFPPGVEPGRPLWRVDVDDPLRPALYIVSREGPDLAHMEEQAGWPSQPTTQATDYRNFLDKLCDGQEWGFRLTANPTHRAIVNDKSRVLAHVTVTQQVTWLLDRQERMGVALVQGSEPTFTVTHREVRQFQRGEHRVTLGTATFEGTLKVNDPELLNASLTQGVGRGKAYGCGLMTLANP